MRTYPWKLFCILFVCLWGPIGLTHLDAQLSYPPGPYCEGGSGIIQAQGVANINGTFSYSPNTGTFSLGLDSAIGSINLANCTEGTYTVVFLPINPNTPPSSTTIQILGNNPSNFSYQHPSYCSMNSLVSPVAGFDPGGTFSALGPGPTVIDSITGEINVPASIDPNNPQHTIQYVMGGNCLDTTTVPLVLEEPVADFDLSSTQYCRSGNGPIQATNISGRGLFKIWRNTVLIDTINSRLGNSNFHPIRTLLNNQPMVAGNYTVRFILDADTSGCTDSIVKTFTILGTNNYTASYPSANYCQDVTTLQNPIITTPLQCINCIEWVAYPNGLNIDPQNGNINPGDNSAMGTYDVYAKITDGICVDSFSVGPVTIDSLVKAEVIFDEVVCKNGHQTPVPLSPPTPAQGSLTCPGALNIGPNNSLLLNGLSDQAGDRTFSLIYLPNAGVCAIPDTFDITVRQFLGSFDYQDTSLCPAQAIQFPVNIYPQGVGYDMYYIQDPGSPSLGQLGIDSACGKIDPQNSAIGTFLPALVMMDSVCADTFPANRFINIFSNPNPYFDLPDEYCYRTGMLDTQPDSMSGDFSVVTQSASGNLPIGPTGMIDLTNSTPGTFLITHSFPQYGCPVDSTQLFTLHDLFFSSIDYIADTFCSSPNDVYYPFTNGGGVGTGSYWSDPITIVHPDSGTLDVSTPGTFTVYYVVDSSFAPCPVRDSVDIHINPGNLSQFSYEEPAYCNSAPFAYVADSTLASLFGRFYCQDTSRQITLDSLTGAINLAQSDTGTFWIEYHLPGQGWCPTVQEASVRIIGTDLTTQFTFEDTLWCQSDSVIFPDFGPGSNESGSFFSPSNVSWANSVNEPFKGINLDQSSPGPVTIGYALQGVCMDTFTFDMTIMPYDSVWLEYDTSTVCNIDSLVPTSFGVYPGSFSEPTGSVEFFDTLTGLINLGESRSGVYDIVYTSNQYCPAKASFELRIESANTAIEPDYSPDTTLCIGDTLTISTFYTNDIYYFVNGNLIASNVPSVKYVVGDEEQQVYLIQDTLLPCPRRYYQMVEGKPVPNLTLPYESLSVAAEASLQIPLVSNIDSTWFHLRMDTTGPVWAEADTGAMGVFMVPGPVEMPVDVHTLDEFVPGTIDLIFTPESRGCPGTTQILSLNVNPGTNPIFVPEVFTPNGDGINETWEIWGNSEVDLRDYHIDVFNQSMGRVYTVKDLGRGWDGADVPGGVYWWLLKDQAGTVVQSGGLTIRKF